MAGFSRVDITPAQKLLYATARELSQNARLSDQQLMSRVLGVDNDGQQQAAFQRIYPNINF